MEVSVDPAPRPGSVHLNNLVEEHRQYSRQLESILAKPYPSEADKIETVRLKKLKLKLKDQMGACATRRGDADRPA